MALARRWILIFDFLPVAFQLLGDQLGEARDGALAHFRADNADQAGVIGFDHHPGIDLGAAVGHVRPGGGRWLSGLLGADWHMKAECKPAGGTRANQKRTTR